MTSAVEVPPCFRTESAIVQPALTPVLTDGGVPLTYPYATDDPPYSLKDGYNLGVNGIGIALIAFPRHGRRPANFPDTWPRAEKLPGAVNAAFFDGHQELIPLERLWNLSWSRDYKPPTKRPASNKSL